MNKLKIALVLTTILFIVNVAVFTATELTVYQPTPQTEFSPVLEPTGPVYSPNPTAKPTPKPKPTPRPTKKPTLQGTSHSAILTGLASWYCSRSIPICHYAYPPGSMVAAACGKLRDVLPNWRGKFVTVKSSTTSVRVKLVDYCASTTKVIDLYYEPMRRLGGTGTLPVKIYR